MVAHSDGIIVSASAVTTPVETNGHAVEKVVKSLPVDFYTEFLSDAAKIRKPSPIRGLFPLENKPGVISLLAGKPNDAMFPFKSLSFNITSPTDPSQEQSISLSGKDLSAGLQYGPTGGLPRLLKWFIGLQTLSHGRKSGEGWSLSMGSGSQDLIYKAVNALVNPGDAVLVESPVYAGVIPMFKSLHCEQIEIETDANGVCSHSLRDILENWPIGKPKPKVFYTVPYGCNPTGMTATVERRKEVLQLAREHNFLILEDDPYFYLYFGKAARPPSYFQLELDEPVVGRVIRFDSFSKILSAGIRMGFASGPKPIIDAIDLHTASANLQSSSLIQAITLALVEEWGYANFFAHTQAVAEFYRKKRDVFESALNAHLSGLAEWCTPEAGMFFWFKLLLSPNHTPGVDEGDSEDLIRTKAYENGVLALPGTVFLPNGRKTSFVRASFSLCTEEQVNEALKRLRDVLLKERGQA
ncbi:pyridoxal phosphate-dependent transferase [Suillus plorans]|uniref:Pyridoxal phosphate-dependent transferase n=1 Tax=Suillus plorans TaxID=116603 RepID=A0A9P7DWG8_9AGAM|nr:pyridoxal phosphate-dependent transferase [Suillus plorans]KAG1804892.1 pyridoxal phosphate-dependent transferase [Suillus plorans]